jgi:hypothetical protein
MITFDYGGGGRNRPDIRQRPVPAPFSGSGSCPTEENFARYLPENVCFFGAFVTNFTSYGISS